MNNAIWKGYEQNRLAERKFARYSVNASWLIKLRWVAVVGQLLTVLTASQLVNIKLPLLPLALVLVITAVSNCLLLAWFNKSTRQADLARGDDVEKQVMLGNRVLAVVMTMDLISLTIMLGLTGGPNNPFAFFFFVNLSLSAVVLSVQWAWRLYLMSLICFVGLLIDFVPLPLSKSTPAIESIRDTGEFQLVHAGLMIAFSTCASVIVYFMARLNHELHESEQLRWQAETAQARYEKLQALGTLAAGTAHELATPLSTIAVVAKEVETEIQKLGVGPDLAEDIVLIRSELDRCRQILNQMNADAGSAIGEPLRKITVEELVEEILTGFADQTRVRVNYAKNADSAELRLPRRILAQAIRGLLSNAIDASKTEQQKVNLRFAIESDWLSIQVNDEGHGMSPDVARRVGEPFFTTKDPGKGMGLGLFLSRSVAEQLGGQLEIESKHSIGTQITIKVPTSISNTES